MTNDLMECCLSSCFKDLHIFLLEGIILNSLRSLFAVSFLLVQTLSVSLFKPSVSLMSPLTLCFSSLLSLSSAVVEDPSPVSLSEAPIAAPLRAQGPVSLSLVCWYRVQSLSFSETCRNREVKHRAV